MISLHTWTNLLISTFILISFIFTPLTALAEEEPSDNVITYIAIGDSLTEGLLENRVLSDSGGYYQYIVEALKSKGYHVQSANLAKSGATSTEIIAQLEQLSEYPNGADVLTVSVGLNDLKPYLYPMSDKTFKEDVAKAHTVINTFQEEVEELEEALIDTEKTFTSLEEELSFIHTTIETTMNELETMPIFIGLTDVEEKVITLHQLSLDLEDEREDIIKMTEELHLPTEDLDEEGITELKEALKSTYQEIKSWNSYITKVSKSITRQELNKDVGDDLQQSLDTLGENLENITNMTTLAQFQLKESYQALNQVSESYDKIPAAKSVIKDSIDVVDKAFANADDEMSSIESNIYTIIKEAKAINPDVDIYILGYYNTKPYMSRGLQERMVTLITSLNETIESTTVEPHVTFVPSYDAFDDRYEELLPNHNDIHPSQTGYQVIAEQFIIALNSDYPSLSDAYFEDDDVTAIIEQAKRNVFLNSNQDNTTIVDKWLQAINNTHTLISLYASIFVILSGFWIWRKRRTRIE